MVFEDMTGFIVPAIVLSLFILIGNPLIVMVIMGILGYTSRTSFMAGLTVAQISEFSMILVALGVSAGHLTQDILAFVTVVGLVTITGSTYFILYSNQLYGRLRPFLLLFERKKSSSLREKSTQEHYDVVLLGCNRIGFTLLESFKRIKRRFLIIDHDPDVIDKLVAQGYDCRYADAGNTDHLTDIDLSSVKLIVSTVPDVTINGGIITTVRQLSQKIIIVVLSHQIDEALELYELGATYVIMPHFLGGDSTSVMVERNNLDVDRFLAQRVKHIEQLKQRKRQGHDHPPNVR